MNFAEITRIIRKEVAKKGYELEERKSTTTNSWYFKIYSGKVSLMFRLSDHNTAKDVITLRTDKKITPKSVEGFVQNRCRDLSDRKMKLLGF